MNLLDRVIEARPELALTVGGHPQGIGWQSSARAFQPDGWAAIVGDYRRRMGGAAAYAAASCALQSHASRICGVAIWVWLLNEADGVGPIWEPEATSVLLRYELGSARAIDIADPRFTRGDAAQLSASMRAHLRPLVDLSVFASGVPRRTAFGDVAASCAYPFVRRAGDRGGEARKTVLRQAGRFFEDWPYPGLVALRDSADGVAFTRRVCCLIYKSPTGRRCEACCLPDPAERSTARWAAASVGSR